MKVRVTGYSNRASVPFKQRKAVCDAAEKFLSERVSSNAEGIDLIFNTMNEAKDFSPSGFIEGFYTFDYKFPNSEFSDMLIAERIATFKHALSLAIKGFFEYEKIDAELLGEFYEQINK